MKKILLSISLFVYERFNISHEQEDNFATVSSIERGVEFKGINVWTLIFAIFVASIGLNVNSTAVIIGAMLISPLMGPIMGLGLSVGIYDFALLKRSLKNLSIAVVISVLTSAIYFMISPLSEAQSELLARTTPTIYDVFIALFGGFAGIVAGAGKEKGNAIPGVAIATALMPPLCTAGYGLATGNIYFFVGAFYLFFINAVMISLSTLLVVRFLKFPFKQAIDKVQSRNVKRYISIIVFLTVVPSIYSAYQIIQETIFKSSANRFVQNEINFPTTQVLNKEFVFRQFDSSRIEVVLTGKYIDSSEQVHIKSKLSNYSLGDTKLIIKQGIEEIASLDMNQLKTGIIEEIYKKNELSLKDKDAQIKTLQKELLLHKNNIPIADIAMEIQAINPKINKFTANKATIFNSENNSLDTTMLIFVSAKSRITKPEYQVLNKWLAKRLQSDSLTIIINN